jgi:DNA polymerase
MNFSLEEADARIQMYRNNSPKVVQYWAWLGHQFNSQLRKDVIEFELRSGRKLRYADPRWYDNSMWADVATEQGYRRTKIWGGVLTENLVSATARDVLAVGLLRLEAAGLKVVMHSHDEFVVECAADVKKEEVRDLITRPVEWMPELELAASAEDAKEYVK